MTTLAQNKDRLLQVPTEISNLCSTPKRRVRQRRLLLTAVTAVSFAVLPGCADAETPSTVSSSSSARAVPRGFALVEAAGVLVKIPHRWTPLLVESALRSPEDVPPEVKNLAAGRSLTVEQYLTQLRGVDLMAYGPERAGITPNFNVVSNQTVQTLPSTADIRRQLGLL
ncbi:hypothetical protein, partial [Gordonia araii]